MIDLDTKKQQDFEIGMDISSIPDNSENYSRTLMAVPPDTPVENNHQDGCQDFPKTIPSMTEPYLGLGDQSIDVDLFKPTLDDPPQSANPIEQPSWDSSVIIPRGPPYEPFSSTSCGDNANFKCHIESETNYVGLVNQAMTCYLNSLLQALYMTPEFRNALYNWEHQGSEKDEALSIPYQLQKLFLNLQTSRKSAVETTSLTRSFGWDSNEAWQQHDIQELCRVMFDALEQKFENTKQADLIKLYEGKMIDYVKCLECNTEKSREDTFLDIPLPVRPYGNTQAYNSVEEAMNAFVQYEKLEGSNQYHCEKCNNKCDANKGLKFTKFPYILTLHLKRFDFDHKFGHRIKLNDKVTFPDELNLNSFISSTSNLESPVSEEDIKCEDSLTTDSGTLDDDGLSPPCENGFPNNHDCTNHDQDDDEGIDISTSNCINRNHESDKQGSNTETGPYVYELFSIMIHSGSANGGHYYANIKDFGTQKWYCFNDQIVSQITHDDIQKTYGGGPLRQMYSGAYVSSTNAYMLMYRQIDPSRNALPMQEQDLPQHIQELLKKMKEYEAMKNRSSSADSAPNLNRYLYLDDGDAISRNKPNRIKFKIFYNPNNSREAPLREKITVPRSTTLIELTKIVYDKFNIESFQLNQCHLVLNNSLDKKIVPFEKGFEDEVFVDLIDYPQQDELLLEIKNAVINSVFVVDLATREVCDEKILLTSSLSDTVMELKQNLSTLTHIHLNEVQVVMRSSRHGFLKVLQNDDYTLEHEKLTDSFDLFVYRGSHSGDKKLYTELDCIIERFQNKISLTVVLPEIGGSLEGIHSLGSDFSPTQRAVRKSSRSNRSSDVGRRRQQILKSEMSLSLDNKSNLIRNDRKDPLMRRQQIEIGQIRSDVIGKNSTSQTGEGEEWNTPEQSNSEDSSLSDSDKTLVGDAPDEDAELCCQDMELPTLNDSNTDEWKDNFDDDYYFEATVTGEKEKLLQVNVDRTMSLGTFKKKLEPYVGVSKEHFSFSHPKTNITDNDDKPLRFADGTRLELKIGKILRNGEWMVQIDRMLINSTEEPFESLFEIVVTNAMTIGQVKKEILLQMERKGQIIPYEKLRLINLRHPNGIIEVLFDNETCAKYNPSLTTYTCKFIVQELTNEEIVTNRNQTLLFVKKYDSLVSTDFQEIVINEKSMEELRDEISTLSGIPKEHLSICKQKFRNLPIKLWQHNDTWTDFSDIGSKLGIEMAIETGSHIFLYRDNRSSNAIELNGTAQDNIIPRKKTLQSHKGYGRTEKPLIIKVNDK